MGIQNLASIAADVDDREDAFRGQFPDQPFFVGPGKPVEHAGRNHVRPGQAVTQRGEMRAGSDEGAVDRQVALVADLEQLNYRRAVGLGSQLHEEILNATDQAGQAEGHLIGVAPDSHFVTHLLGQQPNPLEESRNASVGVRVNDLQAVHFRKAADGWGNNPAGLAGRPFRFRPHRLSQQGSVGVNQQAVVAIFLESLQMYLRDGLGIRTIFLHGDTGFASRQHKIVEAHRNTVRNLACQDRLHALKRVHSLLPLAPLPHRPPMGRRLPSQLE